MAAREDHGDDLHGPAMPPPVGPAAVASGTLGHSLAQAIMSGGSQPGDGAASFARTLSLDAARLHLELTYLSLLTTRFAIDLTFAGDAAAGVIHGFDDALRGGVWHGTHAGLLARRREYRDAFTRPHPDLGRAYSIGRTFARLCGSRHELAVIELGARAYIERLPAVLQVLRGLTVV
jgi:hypothetical protein